MKNENSKFGFLGEELRKVRKEKGLSQEELADKINVSRQSIHLWEAGKIIPDFENIINLCNVLEITTDILTVGLDVAKKKSIEIINIKKYIRIVIIVLIILLITYLCSSIRKSIILMQLNNKSSRYFGLDNYSYKEENYFMKDITECTHLNVMEVYYKDRICKKIYTDSLGNNTIIYEDYNNDTRYNFDEINKTVEENLSYDVEFPENISIPVGLSTIVVYGKENQIINFMYGFYPFLKIETNGSEYIFKWTNEYNNYKENVTEKINKETGLISERYVFKDDGTYTITNYEIKINNTTNEDIEFLNINNYEKIN